MGVSVRGKTMNNKVDNMAVGYTVFWLLGVASMTLKSPLLST